MNLGKKVDFGGSILFRMASVEVHQHSSLLVQSVSGQLYALHDGLISGTAEDPSIKGLPGPFVHCDLNDTIITSSMSLHVNCFKYATISHHYFPCWY